ncbi:MAG: peptidylprolyl isomerase [Planctomycetota bacterium]|nr:peptidylprolyl isomerase [Planctomycetota bacterium]
MEGLVARLAQVVVTLETTQGAIRLRLFTQQAPLTCASFANLVRRGFYDGLTFHRVLPNFMIQGGDPQGNGMGGPGYAFEDEFDPELRHDRPGILSMANAGPRTNGSQFFVTHVATPHLNDKHSVFGVVLSREDQAVVNKIQRGDKIVKASLEGDVSALFGKMKERLAEWNKVLDQRFKNLKPAE